MLILFFAALMTTQPPGGFASQECEGETCIDIAIKLQCPPGLECTDIWATVPASQMETFRASPEIDPGGYANWVCANRSDIAGVVRCRVDCTHSPGSELSSGKFSLMPAPPQRGYLPPHPYSMTINYSTCSVSPAIRGQTAITYVRTNLYNSREEAELRNFMALIEPDYLDPGNDLAALLRDTRQENPLQLNALYADTIRYDPALAQSTVVALSELQATSLSSDQVDRAGTFGQAATTLLTYVGVQREQDAFGSSPIALDELPVVNLTPYPALARIRSQDLAQSYPAQSDIPVDVWQDAIQLWSSADSRIASSTDNRIGAVELRELTDSYVLLREAALAGGAGPAQ